MKKKIKLLIQHKCNHLPGDPEKSDPMRSVIGKQLRPRSHGNAIVPFHLRSTFWNAKIDCSHGNGTIAYRLLFLFTRERNRSVPQFSFWSLPVFPATTTSTHAFRAKIFVPFFGPVLHLIACSHGNGTERLRIVPLFVSLILSFHFLERNDVISSVPV